MEYEVVISGKSFSGRIPKLSWKDDINEWAEIESVNVLYYLINTKAFDLEEMNNYKSSTAYNYFSSGLVSRILHAKIGENLALYKAEVRASQTMGQTYAAWAALKADGKVKKVGCICMAVRDKPCSHAAAILWNMVSARSKTEKCRNEARALWIQATKNDRRPKQVDKVNFKRPKQVDKINVKRPKTVIGIEKFPTKKKLRKPKRFETHQEFESFLIKNGFQELMQVEGSLLHLTCRKPDKIASEL